MICPVCGYWDDDHAPECVISRLRALVRVNLAGPRERHIYEYSEVLFDCPLAGTP